MNHLEAMLRYQEADQGLRKLEQELEANPNYIIATKAKQTVMHAKTKAEACEKKSEEILTAIARMQADFDEVSQKLIELKAHVAESDIDDDVEYSESQLKKLESTLQQLDKDITELTKKAKEILKIYAENISAVKKGKEEFDTAKVEYEKALAERKDEMDQIRKELDELSKSVDKTLMERYQRFRKEKRVPAFYPTKKDGASFRCSRCHMEIDLNTAERLKNGEIVECDTCHYLIYFQP